MRISILQKAFLCLALSIFISSCAFAERDAAVKDVDESQQESGTATLPTFTSPDQLNASPWAEYFQTIYGNVPTSTADFPIDLNSWWTFNTTDLANIGVSLGACNDQCPIYENGQVLCSLSGGDHDLPGYDYIYHKPPYQALDGNQWVEMTHTADSEAQRNEDVGSWMYYVPGSGDYFYLGKTIAFPDHEQAVYYFLGEYCPNTECVDYFNATFEAARAKGYDSVQFLNHADMTCGQNLAIEIVDVAGSGRYACGDKDPKSPAWHKRYKTGWNASLACNCDNMATDFNCAAIP